MAWRVPLAGSAATFLLVAGCGGQSQRDRDAAPTDVALAPCSELVLLAPPRVVLSTPSGSASGPVVVQRDGGFDVLAVFSVERDGGNPSIQARRIELVSARTDLKLGPVTMLAGASGWSEAVALGSDLGYCTSGGVAMLAADGYQPSWNAGLGEGSGACTGIAAVGDALLTAARFAVDGGTVGTVSTWRDGQLESERTPWPSPDGLNSDVTLAALGDGYAAAAALDFGARIGLALEREGHAPEIATIDWEYGGMRTPQLAAWPEVPGAVAAVWRELEGDPMGSPGFPYQPFELRFAVVAPDAGLLLGPMTLATSALAGSAPRLGAVDGKLLVASLLQPDAESDALEVVLTLLDEQATTLDAFSTPARDAISAYPGAAVAALDRHLLLAWTSSEPGDATYRWTEVHAALLECR
jgi:hypothetical protein